MQQDSHLNRYAQVVKQVGRIALQAATEAVDLSQTPAHDHDRASMTLGLPAARMLLKPEAADADAVDRGLKQLAGGPLRYDDSLGHTRPAYLALLIHLHAQAGLASPKALAAAIDRLPPSDDVGAQLWRALCLASLPGGDPVPIVDAIVSQPGPQGELHAFVEGQDLLEAWWYRELVGLHALFNLAHTTRFACDAWRDRAQAIAAYHLENTQPDHTTAQPWAVAAFLARCDTALFGEQQLHDAQSYWTHGPAGSSTVAALLLADAAGTMKRVNA